MKNTMNRILHNPGTALTCLILAAAIEELAMKHDGMGWLHAFELILGILGLASGILSYRNKWVKRTATVLMAAVLLSSGIGLSREDGSATVKATAKTKTVQTASTATYPTSSGYTGGYTDYTTSFSGGTGSESKFCTFCSGTGNCHICRGSGTTDCGGCFNGTCTSCNGTGTYFGMKCSSCYGKGRCSSCNGKGGHKCTWCSASGKCSNCGGKGRK